MSLSSIWPVIKGILGTLTDLLTAGRTRGWWDRRQGR